MADSAKRNEQGGPAEKKTKKTSFLAMGLFLLLLLLLAGLMMIGWFFTRTLNKIERVEKTQEIVVAPENEDFEQDDEGGADTIAPEEVTWKKPEKTKAQLHTETKPRVTNILLIGQDRRPGEVRARSDSMILCSINQDRNEIVLTSLMRDMYVPFPGDYSDNRINAAYAFGGMSLLDQLIEEDFGVPIDGNVEVDFGGFVETMNLIAPLEIELKSYEVGYMNRGTNWNLRQGVNALNGEQLLCYARMRHAGHGDWERTERQRRVLETAFGKVKDMSVQELTELADTMLPCFTTDMTNAEILRLLYIVAAGRMTMGETHRLPVDGTYSEQSIRGMAVLVPDLEQNSALLHGYIYGE